MTPIPIVIVEQAPIEEKPIEIPVESVFMWQKKDDSNNKAEKEDDSISNKKRYRRR